MPDVWRARCRKKHLSVVELDTLAGDKLMAVLAVALFGSRARGDHNSSSDVDLLLVTNDARVGHSQKDSFSMSLYPLGELNERAGNGDLFLYHILFEGRPLYDPDKHLSELKSRFHLKTSYSTEIQEAADLGWFIAKFGRDVSDLPTLSRRITWVVRTILIAISAEAGQPVFSRGALSAIAPEPGAQRLMNQKHLQGPDPQNVSDLKSFLRRYGRSPSVPPEADFNDYVDLFRRTKNGVALGFLSSRPKTNHGGYA